MNTYQVQLTVGLIGFFVVCFATVVVFGQQDDLAELPAISAETANLVPLSYDTPSRHMPDPRTPALQQILPAIIAPDSTVQQQIVIANDEAFARALTVTQQVPDAWLPSSLPDDIVWQADARRWTWVGKLAGGDRDYTISQTTELVPYLDLAEFGVANLCNQFSSTNENDITTIDCDAKQITFNIGQQGRSVLLYGMAWRSLTLHADGFVTFGNPAATGDATSTPPKIMPTPLVTNATLAPLHADFDLSYTATTTSSTQIGRWHAAIIADWIDGDDALYVQWHNAPLSADKSTTARFALILPLWADGSEPPAAETAWYVYDNVSHPSRLIQDGYSIGVQDGAGERGVSYAYSVDGDQRGVPPTIGVLQLVPTRYGSASNSTHTLDLIWRVNADVPENIVSTVELTSDSQQPPLAYSWDTKHQLVRHQMFLPIVSK